MLIKAREEISRHRVSSRVGGESQSNMGLAWLEEGLSSVYSSSYTTA